MTEMLSREELAELESLATARANRQGKLIGWSAAHAAFLTLAGLSVILNVFGVVLGVHPEKVAWPALTVAAGIAACVYFGISCSQNAWHRRHYDALEELRSARK